VSTPNAVEQMGKRGRGRPTQQHVTAEADWGAYAEYTLKLATAIRWPSVRYQNDPVGFFRDILGVEPWEKQAELLEAVRDHDRVACKSGRRVSKSHSAGGLALWFYCSFPDARVVMSSTTARQVDEILWREFSMMKTRAGRCVPCKVARQAAIDGGMPEVVADHRFPRPCAHSALIDGELGGLARTGLKSEDFRQVWGFTARQAEAVQGIAGSRLFFIVDEASGIPQPIYDAIEGNRAGGAKSLLTGNPTKNSGEFFDAFNKKSLDSKQSGEGVVGYKCITISSEDSPNVREGRVLVPGLATTEFIREREIEWGRESPMFKVHVLGEFALAEEGRIFSIHTLREAEERWEETPETGRLYIGCDPAGESGSGDESAFCVRRGMRVIKLFTLRGLNDEGHLATLLGLIQEHALPRETPVVVLDREGSIGSSLYGRIKSYLEHRDAAFDFVPIRSSDRSIRNPLVYDRMRDALAANLEQWFRDGGAIPEDVKLTTELHSLEWFVAVNGRRKLKAKDNIRKEIGRSPDRYDALSLSCWEPLSLREDDEQLAPSTTVDTRPEPRRITSEDDEDPSVTMDPFAGSDAWRR
jgi:hypothetical protein